MFEYAFSFNFIIKIENWTSAVPMLLFSITHTHTNQSRSGSICKKEKDGGERVEQEGIEVEHGMYTTY